MRTPGKISINGYTTIFYENILHLDSTFFKEKVNSSYALDM